ncbi:hypothetical protein LNP74_18855 [Klebsiella pneumoniae subsp. pneumoniae]|nr:hypothetical protein [Klebsiella pneumoniae subsp. pneumoniae]
MPIRMAGTDRISIVLARGWSMEMSLSKVLEHYFAFVSGDRRCKWC